MMNRRQLLKYLSIGTAGVATTGMTWNLHSLVLAGEKKGKVSWGYIGQEGAENWGGLSAQFLSCKIGRSQSPIDLKSPISSDLTNLKTNYKSSPLKIINNGHTIQVNYESGSILMLDGEPYELLQFHFHTPSEHTVDGKSYPMEVHLVHKSEKGSLAVLGIFLKEGQENQALQPIWQKMPTKQSKETTISNIKIDAAALLPKSQQFYRYYGSLTTPPCSEIVNWIVFKEPVEMSRAQIKQFAQIFPMNARPVQKLYRRFVLESN
ncbi:MAG: carbonic anhydrase [Calothrix sp. MO_167.B12]|nr:carbonic anhydrase [Calothrix sp. MO_167.B12]